MQGGWREFFYFSKADRRVMLLLAGMLAGIVLSASFFWWLGGSSPEDARPVDSLAYSAFFDSLQASEPEAAGGEAYYAQGEERKVETFEFDPNTADSTTLLRLGLSPWQVRNIYKYRARGGRYHRPEDFARLYGLTKGDYDRLYPYIRIADEFKLMSDLPPVEAPRRDSVRPCFRQEKFEEGVQVELNAADTATLKKVPGIGPYYARQIVAYRERLGGFVRLDQLREVWGIDSLLFQRILPSVYLRQQKPRPLKINQADLYTLRTHPYLDYYQAKEIYLHRLKYGPFSDIEQIRQVNLMDSGTFSRLYPYLSIENTKENETQAADDTATKNSSP